jgi:hypothetical protein
LRFVRGTNRRLQWGPPEGWWRGLAPHCLTTPSTTASTSASTSEAGTRSVRTPAACSHSSRASSRIGCSPRVHLAIHLDGELGRLAIEIEHVRPRRMLTAELEAAGPLSQRTPEQHLRQRHRPPQHPCASDCFLRRSEHAPPPPYGWSPSPELAQGRICVIRRRPFGPARSHRLRRFRGAAPSGRTCRHGRRPC